MDLLPLQDDVGTGNFFPGAHRREILAGLCTAVAEEIPLLILTGPEGSGKSTLCRQVAQAMVPPCVPVLFSTTIESFEDVVRTVARQLGLDPAVTATGKQVDTMLAAIVAQLRAEQQSLVLIFDQAELIFLATLERIRRMLDRVVGAGARMHLLFAGREAFLAGCDQLAICDFATSAERRFALSPLTKTETKEYLHYQLEGADSAGQCGWLGDEEVGKIHLVAQGNLRLINILLEEYILGRGDERCLADPLQILEKKTAPARDAATSIPHRDGHARRWLPWAGATAVCLAVLVFLYAGREQTDGPRPLDVSRSKSSQVHGTENDRRDGPPSLRPRSAQERPGLGGKNSPLPVKSTDSTGEPAVAGERAAAQVTPPAALVEGAKAAQPAAAVLQAEEVVPPDMLAQPSGEEIAQKAGSGAVDGPAAEAESDHRPDSYHVEEVVGQSPSLAIDHRSIRVRSTRVESPVAGKVAIVDETSASSEGENIVELSPAKIYKQRPPGFVAGRGGAIHLRPVTEEGKLASLPVSVEQLYRQRLLAGEPWERGERDSSYTIQLMALTSQDAEKNLLSMLAQDNFRQEANNFYLFKNISRPNDILVFYGEYQSMTEARLARSTLPAFLQGDNPYPISVKGALAKVRK